ncbi:hypothetical protein SCMU_29660 [Sinomonas cyclohexanicum]|uniref:VWFA domain-containing protein n=1 Tax=Sinomonas cyclohexanicum TaxID=322009 RepID=A0ABN6FKE4_SINCY|nr:vWA domain-containing protein [Corynebacterium cyclohexanicum]BCT77124.1 hypothetical protein SCMU_29660 [Corynebacterium cyclohexanicum]
MYKLLRATATAAVAAGALIASPALALGAGVSPSTVTKNVNPGDTIHVAKTVSTPTIPPKPDIVLVVDSTGSMEGAIGNVKTEMGNIVSTVQAAQPDAQFAVADYKDFNSGDPYGFRLDTDLTASAATAQSAVNSITASGGGDIPESQLNALWEIGSGGNAVTFRPGSSRIVVWFGDEPGHDPSNGHTLADAIASLQGVNAKVLALSVGDDHLDATGQATAITNATGGSLMTGIPTGGVSSAILSGLSNLPAEVTASTTCDTGLSLAFTPALPQTVASGKDLTLDEAITVAADAPQGSTLNCTTQFKINGADAGDAFKQTVAITVNDVTPPTVSCGPGVNPDGKAVPGYQQAGFYQMVANDNLPGVTVSIKDNATGTTFGPYDPGTYFKLTQAPGTAASSVSPFSGAVAWQFLFKGDATLIATDAAGNTATATCTVPPKQK